MRGFDVSNTSSSNQFVPKLLESQAFALFVQDNGPPFRRLHIFDEVISDAVLLKCFCLLILSYQILKCLVFNHF